MQKLLNTFKTGFSELQHNGRLILVGLLIFVFPVLFLLTTQSFLDTAYTNIQTAEKQRVGILHDSLAGILRTVSDSDIGLFADIATGVQSQNNDIKEIQLVQKDSQGYHILYSLNHANIGTYEQSSDIFKNTPAGTNQSYIYEFSRSGVRTWQVVRPVTRADGVQEYIFTEHSFAQIDAAMRTRKIESYVALGGIFLFLIALAYWLMRQANWKEKHDALVRTLEERDLFTNMIAHEFRTPLTAIKGYGSLLADSETLKPNEREYLNKMFVSSERLLALINDFLEVARIQSGRMKLELEHVDVRQVCAEVAEALAPIAMEHTLELHAPEIGAPVFLVCDKKRLFQIIQNLVSNGLKYTEKGSVTFSLEETPLAVTIRVKDTGMGISAEDQQKLFAPFSRVGGVEKSGVTGTGLGMWITKQYVEMLGGSISVESIKGVGTHIVVSFRRTK
jgi:signal transduction histidine kinase